jgi:hypothetical protein
MSPYELKSDFMRLRSFLCRVLGLTRFAEWGRRAKRLNCAGLAVAEEAIGR